MAITSNPGEGGNYQVLGPTFTPGYHFVLRVDHGPKTPEAKDVPAYLDPRGIMPPGTAPASQLSYELFEDIKEFLNVSNFRRAGGGVDLGFALAVGSSTLLSRSTVSLVFFEGHDVIDQPIEDFEVVPGGIRTPTKVFLPLYAGAKWITKGKDLAVESAREYFHRSSENVIGDCEPSISPPLDSLSATNGVFPKDPPTFPIIDTASDIIRLKGPASFVSYVAIDQPLFRDVVTLTSSTQTSGVFFGNLYKVSTVAPYGNPPTAVRIMRYAFVNTALPDEAPLFQWRLAESFGAKAQQVEPTPKTLSLTPEEQAIDFLESTPSHLHLVYNLNDSGPDITPEEIPTPVKTGYSPALARAKMDPTSSFFDKNFKGKIIETKTNSIFFQDRLQIKKIFVLRPSTRKTTVVLNENGQSEEVESLVGTLGAGTDTVIINRVYTSPFCNVQLSANARMGLEYSLRRFARSVLTLDRVITLVGSSPTNLVLSAFHDPCIDATLVHSIDFEQVVERVFYDADWADSGIAPIPTTLNKFMIGESPQRSSGKSAIIPVQSLSTASIGLSPSGKLGVRSISVPPNEFLTAFKVIGTGPRDNPAEIPIVKLFLNNDATGDPAYEVAVPQSNEPTPRLIPIPAARYQSLIVEPFSIHPEEFLSAKEEFLTPVGTPTLEVDEITELQLADLKEETFPVKSIGVSAISMSKFGHACMAFERENRIDLAYRVSNLQPWIPIRDVVKRIPEDFVSGVSTLNSSKTFPSVSGPFLLADVPLGNMYMFYIYKDRLVMKTIPVDLLTRNTSLINDPRFDPIVEADLIASLHALTPVVVFDGDIPDPTVGIQADINFNSIRGDFIVPDDNDENSSPPKILTHSHIISPAGNIFSLIEANQRIRLVTSSDRGMTWSNVLPPDFFFYPQLDDADKPVRRAEQGTEAQGASCHYFESTKTIGVTFVVESALLYMSIPEQILIQDPETAATALAGINPQVIFGELSDDMKNRGIFSQPSVLERKESLQEEFNEKVSPHRMAASSTRAGHFRLFFFNQDQKLKSLISSDGGLAWSSEEQYINSRTTA